MRNPSQRHCKNLPQDEQVLLATMALVDMSMSPELIRKWISRVKPYLYCENDKKKDFKEEVKAVRDKLEAEGMEICDDQGAHVDQRIMPFEFLYLLCNARPRLEILKQLTVQKAGVQRERLWGEFHEGEERRRDLEEIFPFDRENNGKRYNPRHQLQELHTFEAKDTRVKIDDMRNLFKKEQQKSTG